jgi:hypothetical protein
MIIYKFSYPEYEFFYFALRPNPWSYQNHIFDWKYDCHICLTLILQQFIQLIAQICHHWGLRIPSESIVMAKPCFKQKKNNDQSQVENHIFKLRIPLLCGAIALPLQSQYTPSSFLNCFSERTTVVEFLVSEPKGYPRVQYSWVLG